MAVHFTHFYDLVEDYIVKGNVLVHCFAGVSRVSISLILVCYFGHLVRYEEKQVKF